MKLQQKVRYGIACLFELSKHPGEYIDTNSISHRQKVPCAYAHKILQHLAHSGLVLAHKGLGYKLARPLEDITAVEFIDVLTIEPANNTPTQDVGALFELRINQALEKFTLGELFRLA